jgi:hypothetical protein
MSDRRLVIGGVFLFAALCGVLGAATHLPLWAGFIFAGVLGFFGPLVIWLWAGKRGSSGSSVSGNTP